MKRRRRASEIEIRIGSLWEMDLLGKLQDEVETSWHKVLVIGEEKDSEHYSTGWYLVVTMTGRVIRWYKEGFHRDFVEAEI